MTRIASARKKSAALGRAGENAACELLKCCGMKILGRNWKCRAGELDIIAFDRDRIVFVEVKSMRQKEGFSPAGNLSFRQRKRNFNAAVWYMKSMHLTDICGCFDLIEVTFRGPFAVSIIRHQDYLPMTTGGDI